MIASSSTEPVQVADAPVYNPNLHTVPVSQSQPMQHQPLASNTYNNNGVNNSGPYNNVNNNGALPASNVAATTAATATPSSSAAPYILNPHRPYALQNGPSVMNRGSQYNNNAASQPLTAYPVNGSWFAYGTMSRLICVYIALWLVFGFFTLGLFLGYDGINIKPQVFSMIDPSIAQTYVANERFSTGATAAICIVIALVLIAIMGFEDVYKLSQLQRQGIMTNRSKWSALLPAFMWFQGYMITLLLSVNIMQTSEYVFQRLRPDFLQRCFGPTGPSLAFLQSRAPTYFANNYECTENLNNTIWEQGHNAFMSGHAATGAILCTWISIMYYHRYVTRTINYYTLNRQHYASAQNAPFTDYHNNPSSSFLLPLRPIVILALWLFEIGMSGTRLSDHRHNLSDIVIAAVVGILEALAVYYVYVRANYLVEGLLQNESLNAGDTVKKVEDSNDRTYDASYARTANNSQASTPVMNNHRSMYNYNNDGAQQRLVNGNGSYAEVV